MQFLLLLLVLFIILGFIYCILNKTLIATGKDEVNVDNTINFRTGGNPKVLYLMRHGHRLDYADREAWRNHPRYKENALDTPLSDQGHAEAKSNAKIIKEKLDYIYCSPMTRCVETAIDMAEILKVPVRIEYGLCEAASTSENPKLKDDRFVIDDDQRYYYYSSGKEYKTIIDPELYLDKLAKKYPQIDTTYNSMFKPEDIPIIETQVSEGNRKLKIIKALSKHNICIVAHNDILYYGTLFLTKSNDRHNFYEAGQKWTGVMIRWDGEYKTYRNGIEFDSRTIKTGSATDLTIKNANVMNN